MIPSTRVIPIVVACCTALASATAQDLTFQRTATSYESFKWGRVPFSMPTIAVHVFGDDSMRVADVVFIKAGGDSFYATATGNGYLLVTAKRAFIVKPPNESDWTCYDADTDRIKVIAMDRSWSCKDELGEMRAAMGKYRPRKADARVRMAYLAFSSFNSRGNTDYANDSMPLIVVSPDTMGVNGKVFLKVQDNVYRSGAGNYLYMPDSETVIVQDQNVSSWYTAYGRTRAKADQLIAANYNPAKDVERLNELKRGTATNAKRAAVNAYVGALKSQRSDPALETQIRAWWDRINGDKKFPVKSVSFLQETYAVLRTPVGLITRKAIGAMLLYQGSDGKTCWAQWRMFGNTWLGNEYDSVLTAWTSTPSGDHHRFPIPAAGGEMMLDAGTNYAVDCAVVR